MCQISDKIKLCTCKTKDPESLENYWTLNRNEDVWLIGEFLIPVELEKRVDSLNKKTLSKLINSGEIFDTEIKLSDGDVLLIHFKCKQPEEKQHISVFADYIEYAFKFKNGKWKWFDYLPWNHRLIKKQGGKVLKALKKT